VVEQDYWPDGVEARVIYRPSSEGVERSRAEWFAELEAMANRRRDRT
jgi:replication-associated recombination protein RarA